MQIFLAYPFHFRDTVYTMTEKTTSGVYVSVDNAKTLVRKDGITNHRFILSATSLPKMIKIG